VLSAQGYDVDVANDGETALPLVKNQHYDVAVVDYQMPGMNGAEFFREARLEQPDLRGVFLTAYANINNVFSAIDAGATRVLAKPLVAGDLIRLVEGLTGQTAPSEGD
jgi:CheY-like chemotaxis protein